MTIVVASASPEGIALASDSRTIQRAGKHYRVASNTANKVFEVNGRIGIATYGVAMIGAKTIRGLFDEWTGTVKEDADLEMVARQLGEFFQAKLAEVTPAKRSDLTKLVSRTWPLGFVVCGYGADRIGRILEVKIDADRSDVTDTEVTTAAPTVLYRGQTSVLRRMILGVDLEAIREARVTVSENVQASLAKLPYDLIHPVTATDAIEFACFLIDTTIQMQRFSDGTIASPESVPGCGGPIQCLLIEAGGVSWIARNAPTEAN